MKNNAVRSLFLILLALLTAVSAFSCSKEKETEKQQQDPASRYPDADILTLSGHDALLNGEAIEVFDYTWHCDPSVSHDEVKNAPAEYYTGTKPDTTAAAYIDSDLCYFPLLPEDGFRLVRYDGEQEWAYYYTDGENDGFIFATLPYLNRSLPTQMMHSPEEAAKNRVLHITKPGTYVLTGEWNGQIRVELGDPDEAFADENQKVTVILDGVSVNCTVAPGIVFASAYECDNGWEERDSYSADVNTENAGVTVILSDGSDNTVSGTNVYRMLKTKYKDEDSLDEIKVQKKMRKTDAAFYSYVTMNLRGEEKNTGKLTVVSGFEGLDSELHLSFYGGNIEINSQDDGINVNEDHVSVVSFLGGKITLNAALGAEGDGVDSNGFMKIDGGELLINGIVPPDSALDSEDGILYQSGTVTIDGVKQNLAPGSVSHEIGGQGNPQREEGPMPLRPGEGEQPGRDPGGQEPFSPGFPSQDFDIRAFKEKVAALSDDATLDDVLALLGMGGFKDGQPRPDLPPEGMNP